MCACVVVVVAAAEVDTIRLLCPLFMDFLPFLMEAFAVFVCKYVRRCACRLELCT